MKKLPFSLPGIFSSFFVEHRFIKRSTSFRHDRRLTFSVRLVLLGVILCTLHVQGLALSPPDNGTFVPALLNAYAIKPDGTVWAWGKNVNGSLGIGTTVEQRTPVQVAGLAGIVDIKSYGHTLALKSDGTVWSWGPGYGGGLGYSDAPNGYQATPRQIPNLTGIVAIQIVDNGGYAIKSDGTVLAWGKNYWTTGRSGFGGHITTHYGRLGLGSSIWIQYAPMQIANLQNIVSITAFQNRAFALKSDGLVWAWGEDGGYELGDGSPTDKSIPIQINGLSNVSTVDAHGFAIKTDGSLWAWGRNANAELGLGSITLATTPTQISILSQVTQINVVANPRAALLSDGTVWCWGDRVGDGTSTRRMAPIQVPGISGAVRLMETDLGAATAFMAVVKADSTVWAWGANSFDLMDDWTGEDHLSPYQIQGLTGATKLWAGSSITAQKADGTIWHTGYNLQPPSGDGQPYAEYFTGPFQTPNASNTTKVVSGYNMFATLDTNGGAKVATGAGVIYSVRGVGNTYSNRSYLLREVPLTGPAVDIATNGTSMLAVNSDGSLTAWGWNSSGQLGIGTTVETFSPTQVTAISNVVRVAVGGAHSAVVKSGGTVWCWGLNASSQLGDGSSTNQLTPVQVLGLTNVTAVAAGANHTIALKQDGTIWSWGSNTGGQLGDGTQTNRSTPVQVSNLSGIIRISAKGDNNLALKSDGTLWFWGNGSVGDGVNMRSLTPVQVQALNNIVDFEAGYCVVARADGTVWAWGGSSPSMPTQIAGFGQIVAVSSESTNRLIVCALKSDGTVWRFGDYVGRQAYLTRAAIRLSASSQDSDADGMDDSWEMQYFGSLSNSGGEDTDGDGVSTIMEEVLGTDPNNPNTDGDAFNDSADLFPLDYYNNITPSLTIYSGDNQLAAPGTFNANPLDVAVWNPSATAPLVNAPVIFTVTSGGGKVAASQTGTLLTSLLMETDEVGTAQAEFKHSNSPGIASTITATAGNAQVTFHTTSLNAGDDFDSDGLPDLWELQYFGNLTAPATADPDGDGLTNLQEYLLGRNPTKGAVADTTGAVNLRVYSPSR